MRRRSAALKDEAGVYHVASRLSQEGFHATLTRVAGKASGGADVLAGLPGVYATVPIAVRTTECTPAGDCEWRVGKAALADDGGLFVALVDLKRYEALPRVWLVPSTQISGDFASRESGSNIATGVLRRS